MRKKLFYIICWIYAVVTLPCLGVAILYNKLGKPKTASWIADLFLATLARCMLFISGSTVEIEGFNHIPKDEPVLFISNHQGHFDSAVILGHIRKPKGFVASSNASKFPIISSWFNLAHTTYLEKDNVRQNYAAYQETIEIIGIGRSVVIYPEGIISSSPQMGEFKKGAFKLAFATGVPIVPIVIDGTWKVMGEQSNKVQPATIKARILPPVFTNDLTRDEQQELPEIIFNRIKQNLEDLQRESDSASINHVEYSTSV